MLPGNPPDRNTLIWLHVSKFSRKYKVFSRVKKRHKHYFIAFLVGYIGATSVMVYAITIRRLDTNILYLFVFPFFMGGLLALNFWQANVRTVRHRREREDFRRLGWTGKVFQRTYWTLWILAILGACALAVYRIWA